MSSNRLENLVLTLLLLLLQMLLSYTLKPPSRQLMRKDVLDCVHSFNTRYPRGARVNHSPSLHSVTNGFLSVPPDKVRTFPLFAAGNRIAINAARYNHKALFVIIKTIRTVIEIESMAVIGSSFSITLVINSIDELSWIVTSQLVGVP